MTRLLLFIAICCLSLPTLAQTNVDEALRQAFEDMLLTNGHFHSGVSSDRMYFGPEFTFWVPLLDEDGEPEADGSGDPAPHEAVRKMRNHLYKHLIARQADEFKFEEEIYTDAEKDISFSEFYSQFGWNFTIKPDLGVIEVTMSPMSVQKYEENSDAIQDAIFASAANVGYFPSLYGGGGHLNGSLSYLKKRPLLFRNFIVDLLNHNELFLGVFGFDTNNALSPSLFPEDIWAGIEYELNFLDEYGIELESIEAFLVQLHHMFHDSRDPYLQYWHPTWSSRNKHSAFQFKFHYEGNAMPSGLGDRFELRAVRPQVDIYQWIRQIRLIESRIKYLETLDHPIELKPMVKVNRANNIPDDPKLAEPLILNPPVEPQEALKAFYQYVTESGEDWEEHQDYLWPQWHSEGEVEKFNENLCNGLFKGAS